MTRDNPWLDEVTLCGETVRLEPLRPEHRDDLVQVLADGELWRLWYTGIPRPEEVAQYIEKALAQQRQDRALPLVVRLKATGEVVGTTRYYDAERGHRRLSIGYTWYAKRVQRTAVNTECKLLMLGQAFEQWRTIAVGFSTHWHNYPSRAAIARLGAKQDGVLRNHQISADGSIRDTVVFSIIDGEWPTVRQALKYRLEHHAKEA